MREQIEGGCISGIALPLAIMATLLVAGNITPIYSLGASGSDPQSNITADEYLELSVEPPVALTGSLVTLHIAYHHIGLPYTYIKVDPPDLVEFDPPMTMPCQYSCDAITFRALSSGEVQFKIDNSNLGLPVILSGGIASMSTSSLTGGQHTVAAIYSGDGNYNSSTGNLAGYQTVYIL
jgi:hypothetical protein